MESATDPTHEEFPFECQCGERYRTSAYAWACRKCRVYLTEDDFHERAVVDLRTGQPAPRMGW